MKHKKVSLLVALLISLGLSGALQAQAKPKKKNPRAETALTEEETEFQGMIADLQSKDPEQIIFSVQMLGLSARPEAVDPLVTLLSTGPRNDITNMAIQTLGAIGHADAIPALLRYLGHRRPDARLAALNALEGFKGPEITAAFEQKLRDSDPQVRAAAALALGTHGTSASVPLLFTAFDLSVNEAAGSIGKLGSDDDGLKMIDYLGKINIRILLPGFKGFVRRPAISERTKLQILDHLYELAGPEVRKFAMELRVELAPTREKNPKDPVLKLLDQMVLEIAGD